MMPSTAPEKPSEVCQQVSQIEKYIWKEACSLLYVPIRTTKRKAAAWQNERITVASSGESTDADKACPTHCVNLHFSVATNGYPRPSLANRDTFESTSDDDPPTFLS